MLRQIFELSIIIQIYIKKSILPFPVDGVDSASIPLAVVLIVVATTKIVLEYNKYKSRENIICN